MARARQTSSAPLNPPRLPICSELVTKARQAAHTPPSPQQPEQQAPLQQIVPSPQLVRFGPGTHWPVVVSQVWQTGQAEAQAQGPQSMGLPQLLATMWQRPEQVWLAGSGWHSWVARVCGVATVWQVLFWQVIGWPAVAQQLRSSVQGLPRFWQRQRQLSWLGFFRSQ
jgi:hypothetical protein